MFAETKKDAVGSFMVECEIALGVDSKVVHINLEPALGDHIREYVIHEGLERRWSVAKAEEHDGGFEESERSDKCSLPLVFFVNADIVESSSDVKLGEYGGVLHVVNQLRDQGQGICVTNGVRVQVSVVLTRA